MAQNRLGAQWLADIDAAEQAGTLTPSQAAAERIRVGELIRQGKDLAPGARRMAATLGVLFIALAVIVPGLLWAAAGQQFAPIQPIVGTFLLGCAIYWFRRS